jgi:hypothetical protein
MYDKTRRTRLRQVHLWISGLTTELHYNTTRLDKTPTNLLLDRNYLSHGFTSRKWANNWWRQMRCLFQSLLCASVCVRERSKRDNVKTTTTQPCHLVGSSVSKSNAPSNPCSNRQPEGDPSKSSNFRRRRSRTTDTQVFSEVSSPPHIAKYRYWANMYIPAVVIFILAASMCKELIIGAQHW